MPVFVLWSLLPQMHQDRICKQQSPEEKPEWREPGRATSAPHWMVGLAAAACQTDSVGNTLVTFGFVEKACTFILLLSELRWRKTNPDGIPENAQRPLQLSNPAVNPMTQRQERRKQEMSTRLATGCGNDTRLSNALSSETWERHLQSQKCAASTFCEMDHGLFDHECFSFIPQQADVSTWSAPRWFFFKGQGSPGEFSATGILPVQVSCPGTDTALFFIKSELTLPQWKKYNWRPAEN